MYGPQTEQINAFKRRFMELTVSELRTIDIEYASNRTESDPVALFKAQEVMKPDLDLKALKNISTWAEERSGWVYVGYAVYDAMLALSARHLIGETFTQAMYDYLTGPLVSGIGPLHPDDVTS